MSERMAELDKIDSSTLAAKEKANDINKETKGVEAEMKRREAKLEKLSNKIAELEAKEEEAKDLESRRDLAAVEVDKLSSETKILADKVRELQKAMSQATSDVAIQNAKKDELNMNSNRLEGEIMGAKATLAAVQKQVATSKGVEATVTSHLNDMREDLAVFEGKKRALEAKRDEVQADLRSREDELREVERLFGAAKARRELLERDCVRVERQVKEKRNIENELHVLRSSRDLAAGEAMKAEEESLAVRAQLRELEARIVRAKGEARDRTRGEGSGRRGFTVLSPGQKMEIYGGNVDVGDYLKVRYGGGAVGRQGRRGGAEDENLRILKEKIDNVSIGSSSR